MTHNTRTITKREYEYAGSNQHGDRYKIKEYKSIRVLNLSVEFNSNTSDMWSLMAICHSLNVAPKWETIDGKQRMSVDVIAEKSLP
jgi:hypothetical protein